LGLLYCIEIINREFSVKDIEGLKGLGRNNKFLFLALIFFLITSAGFPLSGGFTGKIMLYISLGTTKYIWLIAAGVLSSAVFLYFIFRLSLNIFSGKNDVKTAKIETKSLIILLFLMINGLVSGLYIEPLLNWVKYVSNIFGI
jgi:NADH-quinone oxidoreductase subunit N